MALEIVTVPCLSDNYAFIAHDPATGATAVVDVPETSPILNALRDRGWKASHILITHHHADHVDGVKALAAATGAKVVGAAADANRLPSLDIAVAEGDVVRIGIEEARVMEVPGHTVGHVAYHFPVAAVAFTGDTLMALGCGRVFEGTMEQMWTSLSRLAALPPQTLICSGHEYTLTNGRFALTIEPDNPELVKRVEAVRVAREQGRPTVPSTLAEELATNPFLRAGEPAIKRTLKMEGASDAEVFAEIRRRKDRF
ncbi:hydroxyacylglutathione hydrolase [Albidovulum inexpectatum]|uniref:Hydroxyacylglutathione hydrolase n=1 Tax=Albidovulum inexpectatum TaxID=196587 RepID=A0A2S5JEJ1_9RHOB|nr:hydroxyacylglutathione hydrolase [Albidovulum inexpectatum]PPB79893.1 hydroxyacylglutathione hydrolase [Albidovulum inexpectatum]